MGNAPQAVKGQVVLQHCPGGQQAKSVGAQPREARTHHGADGRSDLRGLPQIMQCIDLKRPLPLGPPFGAQRATFQQVFQRFLQIEWVPARLAIDPRCEVGRIRR